MNIDEFRALKAKEDQAKEVKEGKEESESTEQTKEGESVEEQPESTEDSSESTETQVESNEETQSNDSEAEESPSLPEKIEIDGIGEVDVEELKNGYLRQSDYTKKTQDVARTKKEMQEAVNFYEKVKKNPEALQELKKKGQLPQELDPANHEQKELEKKYYDLLLEREIEDMEKKYDDFEAREVLEVAREKGITNLEDAYKLTSSSKNTQQPESQGDGEVVDKNKLKEELREELKREMAEEGTESVISTSDSNQVVQDNSPKISDAEKKVANGMFRNSDNPIDEYVKWRDGK